MSEFPGYVPPFARPSREPGLSLSAARAADESDDDDLDGEAEGDADGDTSTDGDRGDRADVPAVRVREGLPPSYRMRHEPHYVEALVARSSAPPVEPPVPAAAAAPVTMVSETPVPVPEPDDNPSAPVSGALSAAAATLADAFDAIRIALRDVPLRGRPLRDRVAIELARAEATRGRWLADAAVVMQTDPLPALDEVDLVAVLREVNDALGPESRLSGGAAAMPLPEGTCRVFGDERLLTTAVGAAIAAMRAVIEDRGDARKMAVTLGARDAATRTIEIAQTAVRLPASVYARFFDAEWHDHPAGASGAVLLAAARRIAVAHGGELDIAPLDGGGCCLRLAVPAAD